MSVVVNPIAIGIDQATLYVDMDGALCATDTLWESILLLLRQKPLAALSLPLWVLQGKAAFKRHIAEHVLPDAETLPIRPEVLAVLRSCKESGRRLVLATAADRRIAERVAERVGLFDAVLATDGATNLAASNKLQAIEQDAGGRAFDYLGDSHADLCIWQRCRRGYVAGTNNRVWRKARTYASTERTMTQLKPANAGIKPLIKALRPHQWAKNVLIGVPLLVSHQVRNSTAVWETIVAFIAFSIVASSVYILNDLLDLQSDRLHPTKRNRPFASGAVSIPTGIAMAASLLGVGLLLSFAALGWKFGLMIVLYMLVTTLYSTILKRKLVLDVFVLAGLYTLRILSGAVAIHVEPSPWLLAFSMFLFLSLAFVKRYAELKTWRDRDETSAPGRRYNVTDMELFRSIGPTSAYIAILVFALYINSPDVKLLYHRPYLLWMVCPVMLYWITRLWFLVDRSELMEDPVIFALKDKASYACGLMVLLIVLWATN